MTTPQAQATSHNPCSLVKVASATSFHKGLTESRFELPWSGTQLDYGPWMETSERRRKPSALQNNLQVT